MVLMQKPSVIDSPSGRSPKKAPRWDLTGTEGCGGGKVVSWLSLIDLGYKSRYSKRSTLVDLRGAHEGGGAPTPWVRSPASWLPDTPPTYFFRLYILLYPRNIRECHKTTFPLPQPFVPVRSHLGAFSGDLLEWESIKEGFYINTIASPMKREQFTTDLWVHSYQLDGFFSLFDSQYKVLLDVLGDLFDVILFCGVFAEIR